MTVVNHTQSSLQTNAHNLATKTPAKEPPKAQMGSRQCHNIEMYKRGLVNNLIGGIATTGTGLLVSAGYCLLSQDDADHMAGYYSIVNIGLSLAYVGMITHHAYLVKKYILPEVAQINNAPDIVQTESAAKKYNV